MTAVLRVLAGLLLLAHGLVHLLYFVRAPEPGFPFRITRSWLAPEAARRPLAVALVALTVVAFVLLGLAVWGVPGLAPLWPVWAVAGSAASLAVLVVFWDRQLVLGVLIDLAIVAVAVVQPAFTGRLG